MRVREHRITFKNECIEMSGEVSHLPTSGMLFILWMLEGVKRWRTDSAMEV